MKNKLKFIFSLSNLFVILGIISLVLAWLFDRLEFLALDRLYLFLNAIALFLLAIWLEFWGFIFYHLKQEELRNFFDSFTGFVSKILSFVIKVKEKSEQK